MNEPNEANLGGEARSAELSTCSVEFPKPAELTDRVMSKLWARMAARYGHAWTSQFVDDDDVARLAMIEWREALIGVSPQQVADGLKADLVRGAEWPPSSGAFRAMCFAIPSLASVRKEIRDSIDNRTGDSELSPFALLVWRNLDRWRLKQATHEEADFIFRDGYLLAKEHVMQGYGLPEQLPRIEKEIPVPKELTPEERAEVDKQAKAAIDKLHKLFELAT